MDNVEEYRSKKNNKKSTKKGTIKNFSLLVLFSIVIATAFVLFIKVNGFPFDKKHSNNLDPLPGYTVKIVDIKSKTRPIAVMVNNVYDARINHSGLQDAYLTYELVVEGGLTRLMALYKDASTAKIGSVRSSRHYYLDYALENDAIYVHYGWSPQAVSDMTKYSVNNINGLYDNAFWRDSSLKVAYEHTAFTSIEKINSVVEAKKYRKTSDNWKLLKYRSFPQKLENKEGNIKANNIAIPYSQYIKTSYVYDATNKVYNRFVNGEIHKDAVTKKQYTVKNIITYQVDNDVMTSDDKGRQDLQNIGTGDGYYITEGYAVPIKWTKESRESKTVYKYLNGDEITLNDGNTYIQIQPKGQKLTITE